MSRSTGATFSLCPVKTRLFPGISKLLQTPALMGFGDDDQISVGLTRS